MRQVPERAHVLHAPEPLQSFPYILLHGFFPTIDPKTRSVDRAFLVRVLVGRDVASSQVLALGVQVYRIGRLQRLPYDVQISGIRDHLLEGRDRGQRRPAVLFLRPDVLVERVRVVAEVVLDLAQDLRGELVLGRRGGGRRVGHGCGGAALLLR